MLTLTSAHAKDASDDALQITTTPITPRPTGKVLGQWMDRFFDGDILLVFESRENFEHVLAKSELDQSIRDELRGKFNERITQAQYFASLSFLSHEMFEQKGYVFVDVDLWNRFPRSFVRQLYDNQYETLEREPEVIAKLFLPDDTPFTRNEDALIRLSLGSMVTAPTGIEPLARAVIFRNGQFQMVVNAATWPHLNDQARSAVIDQLVAEHPARNGVECFVSVSTENVGQVARRFAHPKDAPEIERDLRARLASGHLQSVRINIAELMPPFIRDHLNTYAEFAGPNCYNASLNVNAGPAYARAFTSESELEDLIARKYRAVRPDEPMAFGDLMAFRTLKEGKIFFDTEHVATYVTDDLVFTKNGTNKFSPYIFQSRRRMTEFYFPDARFQLVVFRPVVAGEVPLGVAFDFDVLEPRSSHPELEYVHIKYNPVASLEDRRASLDLLSNLWLTHFKTGDLLRLEKDPRAADVRDRVRSLISTNAFKGVQNLMRPVAFIPFGDETANRDKLNLLLNEDHLSAEQIEAVRWIHRSMRRPYAAVLHELDVRFSLNLAAPVSRECALQLTGWIALSDRGAPTERSTPAVGAR